MMGLTFAFPGDDVPSSARKRPRLKMLVFALRVAGCGVALADGGVTRGGGLSSLATIVFTPSPHVVRLGFMTAW